MAADGERMVTVGISPKTVAATVTAGVAPIVVVLLARLFGADVELDAVVAILGPLVLALVTFLAARTAPPGLVVPAPVVEDEGEVGVPGEGPGTTYQGS